MNTAMCEGVCADGCTGDTRRVHVVAEDGYDWGYFMYCETAIKTDRGRGFIVIDEPNESNAEHGNGTR